MPATNTVNDIDKVSASFMRNLGNNKLATRDWVKLVNAAIVSRDTTILTREMIKVRDVKKDVKAFRVMRETCKAIYPKGEFTVKNEIVSFKIAKCKADEKAVERLNEAGKKELGLRDTFLKHVKGETKATAFVAKDADAYTKTAKAWAEKHKADGELGEKIKEQRLLLAAYEALA